MNNLLRRTDVQLQRSAPRSCSPGTPLKPAAALPAKANPAVERFLLRLRPAGFSRYARRRSERLRAMHQSMNRKSACESHHSIILVFRARSVLWNGFSSVYSRRLAHMN
jgi:hypothetical protein